jgi:hypothetical protein
LKLNSINQFDDVVTASAVLCYKVTQALGEENKGTALLPARWLLDQNGLDGAKLILADDYELAG